MWARLCLAVGAVGAIFITPAFALSYFALYGTPSDSPAPWLAALRQPLMDIGMLPSGSRRQYDTYGILYFAAWVLALAGLERLVRHQWWRSGPKLRRAWLLVLGSLAVVALGILGDYAVPNELVGGIGFILTSLGFLGAMVACAVLGRAIRRELDIDRWVAWAVGVLGVVSVIGGLVLVRHIPSGPGAGFALAALVLSVTPFGPRRDRSLVGQGQPAGHPTGDT